MAELEDVAKLMAERKKEITEYMAIWSKVGSLDTAMTKMLRGLFITNQTKPYKARNRFKKMFFTRPMLNLSTPNIIMDRRLATLMSKREDSVERYVRCALDPRQEYGEGNFYIYTDGGPAPAGSKDPRRSVFIDKYQPFIPIISNALIKASGFPDTVLETYTSTPGMMKEVVGWANSQSNFYGKWDMDTTFYNTVQEPIKLLFNTWITYQSMVKYGTIYPYYDYMLGRRIDSTVGIFEIVLDEDNRTINHVAQTIAHPITYTSTPGMMKEVVGWANSQSNFYGKWDMDTTFYNTVQEPIKLLFNTWITYQSMVKYGTIYPYYDYMLGRRIDSTVGIFEIVLDEDNRTINHVAQTIAHPITKPDGKEYDIDNSVSYSAEDTDITMRWACYGALYDDPMSLVDFNRHVSTFNPKLRPYADSTLSRGITEDYAELTPDLYPLFNSLAIPFIDLRYKKLEWLISKEQLDIVKINLEKL